MNQKRIAIYGKGGIGKTTISVNLALILASRGQKVLLVGCDPKTDTTRLLTGDSLPTILDSYDAIVRGEASISKALVECRKNLWCCETGGPKPGVGCAGRGVLIALELLNQRGILDQADVVLYDVLGDVVCGGFATPVTRGYTDRVYVVTSGEQASLLAANNILTGMTQVGGNIGGLIVNARGFDGEDAYVHAFTQRVNVPVIAWIPYSQRIKLEELRRRAICEVENAGFENMAMTNLAEAVFESREPVRPNRLAQDELYEIIDEIGRCQIHD